LSDVQRELGINNESAIIRPDSYGRKELKLDVLDVGSPSIPNGGAGSWKIKNAIAQQKQRELFKYLKELPSKKWTGDTTYSSISDFFDTSIDHPNSGLIFCPHVDGNFGVKTIQSKIIEEFKELENTTGVYSGSSDDKNDDLLIQTQDKFKNNKINLLVATKAFGMGIDKPNIRFTVHLNMPQSVESFYQEAGRAGRDRELAYCSILYSQKKYKDIDGELESNTIDKSNMLYFHKESFRGKDHDFRMLIQLLKSISYKEKSEAQIILYRELGEYFELSLNDKNGSFWLNISNDNGRLGGVNISSKTHKAYPEENSQSDEEQINNIFQILRKHCPSNISIKDWLNQEISDKSGPGFEKVLEGMGIGGSSEIMVPFTNNMPERIAKKLVKHTHKKEWSDIVKKALKNSRTPDEFVDKLEKLSNSKFDNYEGLRELMKSVFSSIRDEASTFKAIYRLSLIGVVDEYSVDYRTKTITAVTSKKQDSKYIDSLSKYISRYISKEESYELKEKISNCDGESAIQKCCSYLTQFVEDKIEVKRLEAINVMESYIQSSLKGGSLSEYINNYFDSKYTLEIKDFLGSDLYESDPDVVWEYLYKTKGSPDAVGHLHGACDRLLIEDNSNPVLLIMRAFTRLLTPYDNKDHAVNDLNNGLDIFKISKNWSSDEYWDNFWKFYEIVKKYNKGVLIYLDNEIVNLHKNEIKKINQRLEGVANA